MKNNSDFEQPIFDNFKELTEEELMQTTGEIKGSLSNPVDNE